MLWHGCGPFDGQFLTRIPPNETRRFEYRVPVGSTQFATISVRMRFRNLPPYFLRALADHQPPDEIPQLGPMIVNLQTIDMVSLSQEFTLR